MEVFVILPLVLFSAAAAAAPSYEIPNYGALHLQEVMECYILSPNFPGTYPSNAKAEASLSFTGNAAKVFHITAVSFNLETFQADCLDKISVIYRQGNSETIILGPFCGNSSTSFPALIINSNKVDLLFSSDATAQKSGFKLYVRVSDPTPPKPVTSFTSGKPSIQPCLPRPSTNSKCALGHGIVGGSNAIPNSYPWQIGITTTTGFIFCGGSIIHPQWIVTAAHCLQAQNFRTTRVKVGTHTRTELRHLLPVSEFIIHRLYQGLTYENDIALIKLASPLSFNSTVSPVSVAKSTDPDYAGSPVVCSGWGKLSENGKPATTLQDVQLVVNNTETCSTAYGSRFKQGMMCASLPGKDSCQGDSGGPLVFRDSDGVYKLVGIVSWGDGCGVAGKPGVYVRVSHFYDWLKSYVSNI